MFFKLLSHVQLFCDPMNDSPPGSSVHGTYQTRILEWVAPPSVGYRDLLTYPPSPSAGARRARGSAGVGERRREAWFPKADWASSIWGWQLRLSWFVSDQFYSHCQFTMHFYSWLYLFSPGYLLSLFKIHVSATNWHLPRAFASNWATTRAFAICLWGNRTLGCCSCWPSTPTEGNSGREWGNSAPGKLMEEVHRELNVSRNWFHDPNPCISS